MFRTSLASLASLASLILPSYSQQVPCQIIIPPFPLTYNGLITPYQTNCDMRINPSFVEAVILDLDTNSLSVYHPLVINSATAPLIPPITFTMPKNPLVGIWFGSNANAITLTPLISIQQGLCVYNIGGINSQDTFGQFGHCNGIVFFEKIKELIFNKVPFNPPIPELGIALDGEPCLTTRDFSLVDMDPSDNVVTTYLVDMVTGKTSQNSFNNQNINPQSVVIKNGSDNLLLANLDNIMGCTPYKVPNLVDPNNPTIGKISSMALDEIHAAIRQKKFYAYIPKGDPMVRINGIPSLNKLNSYRQGIFQPVINDMIMADTNSFCAHYINIQLPRLQKNKQLFIVQPSPDIAISTNLYGFLLNRFSTSYLGLNCNILLDVPNPITLIMTNNLITDGTISLVPEIKLNLIDDPYLLSWDEYPSFSPGPTISPTFLPTISPTTIPTISPTFLPTISPTTIPTISPTKQDQPAQNNISNISNTGNINTNLIIILSMSAFVFFICVYYFVKNNCSNYCNSFNRSQQLGETQPYVDLEKNERNERNETNERNDKKVNNPIKMRNLSPARKKLHK